MGSGEYVRRNLSILSFFSPGVRFDGISFSNSYLGLLVQQVKIFLGSPRGYSLLFRMFYTTGLSREGPSSLSLPTLGGTRGDRFKDGPFFLK